MLRCELRGQPLGCLTSFFFQNLGWFFFTDFRFKIIDILFWNGWVWRCWSSFRAQRRWWWWGPTPRCSPGGLLSYRSPVVFLGHWYPNFTNFDFIIPVGDIREKSYANSFLDSSSVPEWFSINKLYFVPSCWRAQKRRRSGYRLSVYPSRVLSASIAYRSSYFTNVDFAVFTGIV